MLFYDSPFDDSALDGRIGGLVRDLGVVVERGNVLPLIEPCVDVGAMI